MRGGKKVSINFRNPLRPNCFLTKEYYLYNEMRTGFKTHSGSDPLNLASVSRMERGNIRTPYVGNQLVCELFFPSRGVDRYE